MRDCRRKKSELRGETFVLVRLRRLTCGPGNYTSPSDSNGAAGYSSPFVHWPGNALVLIRSDPLSSSAQTTPIRARPIDFASAIRLQWSSSFWSSQVGAVSLVSAHITQSTMLLYSLRIPTIDSDTLIVLPILGHPALPVQDFDAVGMLVPGRTDVQLTHIFARECVTFFSGYAY